MTWQPPSLTALRTFEVAARHLSFTKAAIELDVTQSAVSHQVALLEERLGVLLFQRVKQRLVLTEGGQRYAADIRDALGFIQTATVNLLAHQGGALNISTAPAFCTKWLIPRLSRFTSAHPNVVINLATRDLPFDFEHEHFDAAFHYGANDWPEVQTDSLVGSEMAVVCSPQYLQSYGKPNDVHDLKKHILLQHTRRPNNWRKWMEAMGAPEINAWAGPRFEHFYMIIQAAGAHLGLGLLPRLLVEDELAAGRLVVPLDLRYFSEYAYCFVFPVSKRNDPRLQVFRRWLLDEANRTNGA